MGTKFSTIITTCKREPEILKEAIDSVLGQTYENIEIIVVNDAPNYSKREDVEQLIASYKGKVRYFVNEVQKGANYSRNYGAAVSTGQILSFLDDDDYWDPQRTKKVVDKIQEGFQIVYSDISIFSEKESGRVSVSTNPTEAEKLKTILGYNYLRGFSNVSFTKEIFEKAGRLDEKAVSYQDQDLFIRMVPIGKVCYIPEPLSYYRITENSISLNSKKKYDGLMQILTKYEKLYERYPESKIKKLENDYVYALRNGWSKEAKSIGKQLKKNDSVHRLLRLFITGKTKYIVLKILRK